MKKLLIVEQILLANKANFEQKHLEKIHNPIYIYIYTRCKMRR